MDRALTARIPLHPPPRRLHCLSRYDRRSADPLGNGTALTPPPRAKEFTMTRLLGSLTLLACGVAVCAALAADKEPPKKDAPEIKPREGKSETFDLFNGKDLKGWEGYEDLWSVKEGEIVGKNDEEVKVSTYLLTKKKFTDFRLLATVKLVKSEMHSGIAFWGSTGPEVVPENLRKERVQYTYAGHLVMFPSGWGMYDLFGRQ